MKLVTGRRNLFSELVKSSFLSAAAALRGAARPGAPARPPSLKRVQGLLWPFFASLLRLRTSWRARLPRGLAGPRGPCPGSAFCLAPTFRHFSLRNLNLLHGKDAIQMSAAGSLIDGVLETANPCRALPWPSAACIRWTNRPDGQTDRDVCRGTGLRSSGSHESPSGSFTHSEGVRATFRAPFWARPAEGRRRQASSFIAPNAVI